MAGIALKLFYGVLTILLGGFIVLPLVIFGVFTFTLAVWFLCTLALFKWVGAIWRSLLHWWKGDPRNSPEAVAQRERAAAHAKRLARSQSGSTSASLSSTSNTTTRSHSNRSNRSNSNVSLATLPQLDRDYEGTCYYNFIFLRHLSTMILTISGVGGWLTPGAPSNGGYLPLNINNTMNSSRDSVINLSTRSDTTPPTFRRRSFGASSNGINSPEALSTPSNARHSAMGALHARTAHGSVSPQSYFNNGTAARSTTSINSRRGSVMATRRETEETDSDDEIVMTSRH